MSGYLKVKCTLIMAFCRFSLGKPLCVSLKGLVDDSARLQELRDRLISK